MSDLTRVVLDDIAESLQSHLSKPEPLSVLLGLHLVTLTHGQQSVEVLGLGAYVVQQTGCKCFWILEPEMEQHISSFKVYMVKINKKRQLNIKN